MIPLLFEVGLTGLCSEVWLVDCEESQQLERLMLRNGLSEADARARAGRAMANGGETATC